MRNIFICICILLTQSTLNADVKLPAIFGDHMILQRQSSIPVWGRADPGETVTVQFADQTAATSAGADGKWKLALKSIPSQPLAQPLTVTGKNKLIFQDVLVGDVWLCAGQSNMEYQLVDGEVKDYRGYGHGGAVGGVDAAATANDPQLRLFHVKRATANDPASDLEGKWEIASPDSAKPFSAIGYFFGRELRRTQHQPIGLIGSYWGGTGITFWISYAGLEKRADVLPEFTNWKKQREIALADPTHSKKIPTSAQFNGMIAPLAPYAIKGVLWYQGEAHANNKNWYRYGDWLSTLIGDWRDQWAQADLPFLIVQLAAHGNGSPANELVQSADGWPGIREAQLHALSIPHTGLATAIDIGDLKNVHPKDKLDVANRLALVARNLVYGENLVCSGPVYSSMKVESNKIRVSFSSTGSGLIVAAPPWNARVETTVTTDHLQGFAIAGADRHFVWADATIEADTVLVSSNQVPNPVAVRYGWANYPYVNLYNKEMLPAVPFRSDDWRP